MLTSKLKLYSPGKSNMEFRGAELFDERNKAVYGI